MFLNHFCYFTSPPFPLSFQHCPRSGLCPPGVTNGHAWIHQTSFKDLCLPLYLYSGFLLLQKAPPPRLKRSIPHKIGMLSGELTGIPGPNLGTSRGPHHLEFFTFLWSIYTADLPHAGDNGFSLHDFSILC